MMARCSIVTRLHVGSIPTAPMCLSLGSLVHLDANSHDPIKNSFGLKSGVQGSVLFNLIG
jgi:hypothetical protein